MTNTFDYWFKHKLLDLPYLASRHGEHVDDLIVYVHALMAVLFVGWLAYFLYAIFRFRKSKHPKADYVGVKGHVSNWIEGGVAVVEAILLIGFAVPLWAKVVTKPPSEKESTVIHVLAKQFNWNAHYAGPDGIMGRQDQALAAASGGSDPFGVDRANDPNARDDVVVMGNFVVRKRDAVRELAGYGCVTQMHVVRLLAPRLDNENHTKDIDFTPSGIRMRREAGYEATMRALTQAPWRGEFDPIEGVILHESMPDRAMAAE